MSAPTFGRQKGAHIVATGRCYCCRVPFTFNPELVPSHEGQPICRRCLAIVNELRARAGLEIMVPEPGAYDPQPIH